MILSFRRTRLVVVAALCGLASLTFTQVFTIRLLVVPISTGVVGALAISLVGARLPHRRTLTSIASCLAMLVVGGSVVLHSAGGAPLVGLWRGFVDGWARILSTTLPARDDPVMLFVPFAVTWAATAVACEVAVSAASAFAPVAPAAAIVVVARLFGVAGGAPMRLVTVLFLILAVLLGAIVAGRTPPAVDDAHRRRNPVTGAVTRHRVATALP
nr:hypothetical protein [Actinomycetota bacterium]